MPKRDRSPPSKQFSDQGLNKPIKLIKKDAYQISSDWINFLWQFESEMIPFDSQQQQRYGKIYELAYIAANVIQMIAVSDNFNFSDDRPSLRDILIVHIRKSYEKLNESSRTKILSLFDEGICVYDLNIDGLIASNPIIFTPNFLVTSFLFKKFSRNIQSGQCYYAPSGVGKSYSTVLYKILSDFVVGYLVTKRSDKKKASLNQTSEFFQQHPTFKKVKKFFIFNWSNNKAIKTIIDEQFSKEQKQIWQESMIKNGQEDFMELLWEFYKELFIGPKIIIDKLDQTALRLNKQLVQKKIQINVNSYLKLDSVVKRFQLKQFGYNEKNFDKLGQRGLMSFAQFIQHKNRRSQFEYFELILKILNSKFQIVGLTSINQNIQSLNLLKKNLTLNQHIRFTQTHIQYHRFFIHQNHPQNYVLDVLDFLISLMQQRQIIQLKPNQNVKQKINPVEQTQLEVNQLLTEDQNKPKQDILQTKFQTRIFLLKRLRQKISKQLLNTFQKLPYLTYFQIQQAIRLVQGKPITRKPFIITQQSINSSSQTFPQLILIIDKIQTIIKEKYKSQLMIYRQKQPDITHFKDLLLYKIYQYLNSNQIQDSIPRQLIITLDQIQLHTQKICITKLKRCADQNIFSIQTHKIYQHKPSPDQPHQNQKSLQVHRQNQKSQHVQTSYAIRLHYPVAFYKEQDLLEKLVDSLVGYNFSILMKYVKGRSSIGKLVETLAIEAIKSSKQLHIMADMQIAQSSIKLNKQKQVFFPNYNQLQKSSKSERLKNQHHISKESKSKRADSQFSNTIKSKNISISIPSQNGSSFISFQKSPMLSSNKSSLIQLQDQSELVLQKPTSAYKNMAFFQENVIKGQIGNQERYFSFLQINSKKFMFKSIPKANSQIYIKRRYSLFDNFQQLVNQNIKGSYLFQPQNQNSLNQDQKSKCFDFIMVEINEEKIKIVPINVTLESRGKRIIDKAINMTENTLFFNDKNKVNYKEKSIQLHLLVLKLQNYEFNGQEFQQTLNSHFKGLTFEKDRKSFKIKPKKLKDKQKNQEDNLMLKSISILNIGSMVMIKENNLNKDLNLFKTIDHSLIGNSSKTFQYLSLYDIYFYFLQLPYFYFTILSFIRKFDELEFNLHLSTFNHLSFDLVSLFNPFHKCFHSQNLCNYDWTSQRFQTVVSQLFLTFPLVLSSSPQSSILESLFTPHKIALTIHVGIPKPKLFLCVSFRIELCNQSVNIADSVSQMSYHCDRKSLNLQVKHWVIHFDCKRVICKAM